MLQIILRTASLAFGVLLIYVALFLYEDEEGKLQNKLESWWQKLYDLRGVVLSRHAAFMNGIASLTSYAFDRLFGDRLLSIQAIAVSTCFSFASLCLGILMFFVLDKVEYPNSIETNDIVRLCFYLAPFFFAFLIVGGLPWFFRTKAVRTIWLAGVCILLIATFLIGHKSRVLGWSSSGAMGYEPNSSTLQEVVALGLIVGASTMSDFFFITLTRAILRWSAAVDSFIKISVMVITNLTIATLMIGVPFMYSGGLIDDTSMREHAASLIAGCNILSAACGLLFVLLAFVMLAHRLVWPVLTRPVYSMARYGLIGRKKLLATIGIVLVGYAVPRINDALAYLLKLPWG